MTNYDYLTILDQQATLDQALNVSGQISSETNSVPQAHVTRQDYIVWKRGKRALGGFFQPTRANVTAKFAQVWLEENTNN